VKCILRSKVLLEHQVILGVDEVKLQSEVKNILQLPLTGIEPSFISEERKY
jgi:hypothetical protein